MITITQGYDIEPFYTTTDGEKFEHLIQAEIHQRHLEREKYNKRFLKKRNWIQRLSNVQPPRF